jgi:hypothetical protein
MHSRVQQLNKISGSNALALGYFQQFNDSAFHNLRLGSCGLPNTIHCHLSSVMHFAKQTATYIQEIPRDFRWIVDRCLFKTAYFRYWTIWQDGSTPIVQSEQYWTDEPCALLL